MMNKKRWDVGTSKGVPEIIIVLVAGVKLFKQKSNDALIVFPKIVISCSNEEM